MGLWKSFLTKLTSKKNKSQEDGLDNLMGYEYSGKPSYPFDFIVERFISKSTMPLDQQKLLESISQDGYIVYALKYESLMDIIFLKTRLYQMGLPEPDFTFDMPLYRLMPFFTSWRLRFKKFWVYLKKGSPDPYESDYYLDCLKRRKRGVLFLLGKESYYKRAIMFGHDPLYYLLEIQKHLEKPIFLVPSSVVYLRQPSTDSSTKVFRWSSRDRVSGIKKCFHLFRGYRHTAIEIGEPLNLQAVLPEMSTITVEKRAQIFNLRQSLVESIDKINRAIIGPALKSKLELKEMILNNPRLQGLMHRRAKSRHLELWKVQKEVDGYLEEIAADYSYTMIKWMEKALNWIWNNIFDGVEVDEEGLRKIKKLAQNHTLVYIPSHKSHIDYLLLSHILFLNNLKPPFIAAGKNLSFWPMGPIFRRGGAFFIRRSFAGQRFYAEVFALYVKTLVQLGHNIEFFIEGGRSRTGKLILPKLGLLSILIQAYEEGYCDDLIFIPTAICYDRIPEEESYVRELKGESKKTEDIKQLVKARGVLKKRYGKVYIRFGKPISLSQHIERENINLKDSPTKIRHEVYRDFAFKIITSINQASLVTSHALIASAVLSTARAGITFYELSKISELYYSYLRQINVKFAKTFGNYRQVIEETLYDLEKSKIIERIRETEETDYDVTEEIISIDEKKRHTLEYYKNNCIHFFLPAAFVSLSLTSQQTLEPCHTTIVSDYKWLKKLFKYEFAYDKDYPDERAISDVFNFFHQNDFFEHPPESENPSCYRLTHEGLISAKAFASILYNYLEGYKVCLMGLKLIDKKGQYPVQDFIKKLINEGNKALKLGIIERPEAISKVMYENSLRCFEEVDIVTKKVEKEGNGQNKVPREYFVLGTEKTLALAYLKEINRFLRRG